MNNLAGNFYAQGRFAEAAPLLELAASICERTLGAEHPLAATGWGNLAVVLDGEEKYTEAEALNRKALAMNLRLRVKGEDNLDTARINNNLARNLYAKKKHAEADELFRKALAIWQKLLGEEHRHVSLGYFNVGINLDESGKHALAEPFLRKSLAMRKRLLGDDHPDTAWAAETLAANLNAQGNYPEARDVWLAAAKSRDAARVRTAFTGLERVGAEKSARPALAAVLARLGNPKEAWQQLEEDLGRGLLDELSARHGRLTPDERARRRELTAALDRLDRLMESRPSNLDQADRAKRLEDLRRQHEQAGIALSEFQDKLAQVHGPLAGQVAKLEQIQAALPADTALVTWVDVEPVGPGTADPNGSHWGVVVRSSGSPAWVPLTGTGANGAWTKGDTDLAGQARTELRSRPGAVKDEPRRLLIDLRNQRLAPLEKVLRATPGGLPAAARLIVLPSHALPGVPLEALLTEDDTPHGELRSLGHRIRVPAQAASARLACGSPGARRPGLQTARRCKRCRIAA